MNEVRKCSLSGVAFTMDVDAYDTLARYIETLKKSYEDSADGEEIVADIEARIAELILSAQDNTRVVERPLIENIIRQMGSAEDISDTDPAAGRRGGPRIPRRLYRDTENAKLGGVCSGIGRYFDVDPVWVRLALFLPLLLTCFRWVSLLWWMGPMMGNLFGIFVICYLIMWFAVPAARTARQKLEMTGERITEQTIRRTTEKSASSDPDSRARPVVAEAVSVFGQIVLMVCKIFAGLLVFGFIMVACGLIIGLFALIVGGHDAPLVPGFLQNINLGIPILGILVVLIPTILLIYVLMCLIASRKPGGKTVLAIFLIWILGIVLLGGLAVSDNAVDRVRKKYQPVERALDSEVIIEGDTTTLREMLRDFDDEQIVEDDLKSVHISVPSKGLEIVVDKETSQLDIQAGGKRITMRAEDGEFEVEES
ncbi:MAG: PspC domain-containing protein [Alistipes sp.]|nr:PspC domain-containing protein [Alistipes senegalensis]MCM1251152.1 PspC domain-containing protein [Alistipes sp.]